MTTKVFMHSKPMIRHSKHVQPARANISIALPPHDGVRREPGLYIELRLGEAMQLVAFPIDQLDELDVALKALRAVRTND